VAWRSLGKPEDLDLDFGAARDARRSALVTRVLVTCGDGTVDDAAAWQLTLSGRVGGLAAVVALTREAHELPVALRCHSCREQMVVGLPLDTVLDLARRAEDERVVSIDREEIGTIAMRRPTGDDQRRWQERQYASWTEAEHAVMQSLLQGSAPDALDVDQANVVSHLAVAMQELDPLPSLTMASTCPACGADGEHVLDVEALLLTELAREQRSLLREVHEVATRYGWSEQEVLALPRWRRRAYLALIDEETR
jgi:hypothetical protein